MSRLFYTGALMVDIVLGVPQLPEPGGDAFATFHQTSVGGGFNVLSAARRDGLEGIFAGRTGTGPFGDLVREALDTEGLESWHVPVPDLDNGFCVVLVEETTERTFITMPGAEECMSVDDLRSLDVRADDFVHVSGYALASRTRSGPLSAWVSSLSAGPGMVLDASPLIGKVDPDILGTVLARTDVLTCNAREAGILAGTANSDPSESDLAGALAVLRSLLPSSSVVILRDGPRGTWVMGPERPDAWHVPPHNVVAVDTNGAGDAHTGVLMAALAAGVPLPGAVIRANVAAALAVTRRGPATAPVSAEIDETLAYVAR